MNEITLAKQSFEELYGSTKNIAFFVRYSGRFADFNANISFRGFPSNQLTLSLAKSWQDVDDDLKKGLFQSLYLKVFAKKYKPLATETVFTIMYASFVDKIGRFVTPNKIDPVLKDSFDRMNELYFNNTLETPNLIWGSKTFRKIGSYTYQTDTITMSPVIADRPDLIDFVMHHEMLHKKHRFYTTKTGRNMHHHKAFRDDEAKYPHFELLDKELSKHVRKKRRGFLQLW